MPFQRTDPASSAVKPKMARIAVVLPAPLGPRNPTTWPEGTEKESPSRAVTGPNRRVSPSSSKRPLIGPRLEGSDRGHRGIAAVASPRCHRGGDGHRGSGIAAVASRRQRPCAAGRRSLLARGERWWVRRLGRECCLRRPGLLVAGDGEAEQEGDVEG